jgi:glutamyl-tRNA synthetase
VIAGTPLRTVRTRFAPSPTGDLHLGGAWAALASWVVARRAGGQTLLRIEDIDTPRVVAGAEARIIEDLRWLGLDWDEHPVRQSERTPAYLRAIAALTGRGLVYPCDCSRTDIARVAQAPHAGEESRYPGSCRDKDPARAMKRPPALRVRVPEEIVTYDDGALGAVSRSLTLDVGDFVLRRGDGVFAYQLAVVVDDADAGVTDVVRGADLATSTPRQIWLAGALGLAPPRYTHVPLVVAADGSRLEKRRASTAVRALREGGVRAEAIIGTLAHGLGLAPDARPRTATEVAEGSARAPVAWRAGPWPSPVSW